MDNPNYRGGRGLSMSSDDDSPEVKQQSSQQSEAYYERSIRIEDSASHCKYTNVTINFIFIF